MAFLTDLCLRYSAPDDDGHMMGDGRWTLLCPLVYRLADESNTFVVPTGFETDLASVPRIPVAYMAAAGVGHRAAVLHDWLCRTAPISRKEADGVLYEALKVTGVSWWRRWMFYTGVRVGAFFGVGAPE
jgi:hypothetical protein